MCLRSSQGNQNMTGIKHYTGIWGTDKQHEQKNNDRIYSHSDIPPARVFTYITSTIMLSNRHCGENLKAGGKSINQ